MNKPPAFQFYVDDFLGGTMHFTDAETGLYVRLLCVQWSTGSLPDDDAELKSYGKGDTPIARVKMKFVKRSDGRLVNERMEAERQKQAAFRSACSDGGKKGGGNPNFKVGQRNPYYRDKGSDKGKIISPSPSPSPSPTPIPLPSSNTEDAARPVRARFEPPTLEMVKLQAAKIGLPDIEAERFLNFYESNGWHVGRNGMKSWPHALTNWKLNQGKYDTRSRTSHAEKPNPRNVGVCAPPTDWDAASKRNQERWAEKHRQEEVARQVDGAKTDPPASHPG